MTTLIDSKYVGGALCCARRSAAFRRMDAAKLLNTSYQELLRYERGQAIMPPAMLHSLLTLGFMMMRARNFVRNQ